MALEDLTPEALANFDRECYRNGYTIESRPNYYDRAFNYVRGNMLEALALDGERKQIASDIIGDEHYARIANQDPLTGTYLVEETFRYLDKFGKEETLDLLGNIINVAKTIRETYMEGVRSIPSDERFGDAFSNPMIVFEMFFDMQVIPYLTGEGPYLKKGLTKELQKTIDKRTKRLETATPEEQEILKEKIDYTKHLLEKYF